MFRKILMTAVFITITGTCLAVQNTPQIVTSEVVYTQDNAAVNNYAYEQKPTVEVPVWPIIGSDADVVVSCDSGSAECSNNQKNTDNIRIVSKIGSDLVVENNFNMNSGNGAATWSGGADMLHGNQVPAGFDDECNSQAEMPLMHREMLEDDGGEVLSASRSSHKNCGNNMLAVMSAATDESQATGSDEIAVDQSADAEAPKELQDQVRSWVVASGQTLHQVLQDWCDKEGWDFVWATPREYPIAASAVFKGRFVDVASALVRNFGRATPIPYAKFYKGNRVLVISTTEE